jgi:uncharacterized metal-binding protein
MSDSNTVLIIPCSGIGKAFGSVGREAMYRVVEDLCPANTDTVCLSLLTLGDADAQAKVRAHATITIDGCPTACAKVNVEAAGGRPVAILRVSDTYRAHKALKVRKVSELGENGHALANFLADEIVAKVSAVTAGTLPGDGKPCEEGG